MSYVEALTQKYSLEVTPRMKARLEVFNSTIQYQYGGKEPLERMSVTTHRLEVGKAAKLTADMICGGATEDELIRVIKYGMVVVDALKHNLDYKKAKTDFGIQELHKKYRDK